jgi:predicted membrane channel-forming protein YqfA (hemolysin III family)
MLKQFYLLLILLLLSLSAIYGQISNGKTLDSIKRSKHSSNKFFTIKKTILPVTLIGIGVLINNTHFEKKFQIDLRNKVGNTYEFKIDNYVQFMPIAEMYVADAFKIKAKNHWFDQTKYLFISNFISASITHSLKKNYK